MNKAYDQTIEATGNDLAGMRTLMKALESSLREQGTGYQPGGV
jgi:hypothetical protein